MMKRRAIAPSEALAIDPRVIRSDRKSIWWDYGPPIAPNDEIESSMGTIQVVHVRGSLEHHAGIFGDSYDGLRERFCCAFEEDPAVVVARIDSPGGVVSGLDEFVRWLRRESDTKQIPVVAYVDELAASAAYAICCGCTGGIAAPKSAITGSIGVISTLYDQTKADKKMGLRFVTRTSGARKSDGHPHVSISDDAIAAEDERVVKLARQFYRLVAEARPIPLGTLKSTRGFEAGIFLGEKAEEMGLIDDVSGWDDFLAQLTLDSSGPKVARSQASPASKGNETDRRSGEDAMLTLKAELKKLQAKQANETDPVKLAALAQTVAALTATIEAAKKIVHEKHEKKTVNDDSDGDGDDEGDEDEEEEDEAAMADDDGDDDDSDDDGDDDGDEDDEEDEEEEAKYEEDEEKAAKKSEEEEAKAASVSLRSAIPDGSVRKTIRGAVRAAVRNALAAQRKRNAGMVAVMRAARKATGQKSASAIAGALQAMPARREADARLKAEVDKLKADRRRTRVNSMLEVARKDGRVTKAEVESLRAAGMRDPKWLKGNLATRPKVVRGKDGAFVPREGTAGAPGNSEQEEMMKAAMLGLNEADAKKFEEGMKAKLSETNGSPKF